MLTKGLDGCLSIYPMEQWKIFEKKLEALPLTNKNARKFSRFFVAGATTCELDRQGRILVPATLREFAGLEKDVVLTGNLNRKSGARRSGVKIMTMMIWMRLQKICRKWELSSRSGEKRSKSVRWSLNTNRYY